MTTKASSNRVFVGRQREMLTLTAAMADVLAGQGRLAMLAGEPGIGKTRTAQELAAHAETLGAQVLWGRCSSAQGAPSYWPWVQVIRSNIQGQDAAQLSADMGAGAADIAEIVPEVKQLLPGLPPPPALEPEQARFRLFDSITNYLKSASQRQPLVLVMEDLHWADQPSLLMLEFLARELAKCRLFVLGTYRDTELTPAHPLHQTLGELAREPAFPQVSLAGLDEEDEGRFIEIAASFSPPADLVTAVHAMTEGNPLFMTEVVRLLVDNGELSSESDALTQEWKFKIPGAVSAVIRSRLDRLSDSCNQVLRVASLTGRDFDLGLLEWLKDARVDLESSLPAAALLGLLEEALAARVIEEVPDSVGRYQFSHVLIQESLSGQLSSVRRARMHADIGQALEDRYQDNANDHAAELAYHFSQSETVTGPDKLVRYSLQAGEQALAAYAFEDALSHFERGLAAKKVVVSELASSGFEAPDEQAAELRFGLARAQRFTLPRHRLSEVEITIKPAFDYYVRVGDVPQALAITDFIGGQLVRGPISATIFTEALNLVPSDSRESGRILSRYADVLDAGLGDHKAATDALDKALEIAQRGNDALMEIHVLAKMGSLHYYQLEFQESLDRATRAIELIPSISPPPNTPVYWHVVRDLICLGRIEEARLYATRQLELAEESRSRFALSQALHANGFLAYLQGNWEEARDFGDRGLEIDDRDVRLLNWRSELEYEVGDFAAGDLYLDRILQTICLATPDKPQLEHGIVPQTIGVAARITGDTSRFYAAASSANLVLASPAGLRPRTAQLSRTGLALLAIVTGDANAAEEQYPVLKSWEITRTPVNLMCGDRVLGLPAQTMGNLNDATGHFEDALSLCLKAGYRPELAWTCHDYATCLLARDKPGDRYRALTLLNESMGIATDLGMQPLLERAATLQAQIESGPEPAPVPPDGLSPREVEVLRLIADGRTSRDVAEELVLSIRTVERHITNIYRKINARGRAEATAYALGHGLLSHK